MDKNNTAVISLKSLGSIPRVIVKAILALYKIAPIKTIVVDFKKLHFLNTFTPMITAAQPITMVPVPIDTSKNCCC